MAFSYLLEMVLADKLLKNLELFMFSRVFPSWEQIGHFKQPLTEGEWCLLTFLDDHLKKDELFQDDDLTKYNGWLIFVQPYLNGCRPDIIIFNPGIGVQIFEVKDWNLDNYSFENKNGNTVFCVSNSRGTYPTKSPVRQVEHYKAKIAEQLVPQIGESFDENAQNYGLIKTAVYFHKSKTAQAQVLFQSQVKDISKFPIFGLDALSKNNLDKVIPDNHRSQSIYSHGSLIFPGSLKESYHEMHLFLCEIASTPHFEGRCFHLVQDIFTMWGMYIVLAAFLVPKWGMNPINSPKK